MKRSPMQRVHAEASFLSGKLNRPFKLRRAVPASQSCSSSCLTGVTSGVFPMRLLRVADVAACFWAWPAGESFSSVIKHLFMIAFCCFQTSPFRRQCFGVNAIAVVLFHLLQLVRLVSGVFPLYPVRLVSGVFPVYPVLGFQVSAALMFCCVSWLFSFQDCFHFKCVIS